MRTRLIACLAMLLGLIAAGRAAAAEDGACVALARAGSLAGIEVVKANSAPADAAQGLPAYCEIQAVVASGPGSHIGVVYRLPEGWNGKFVGFGGGAWGSSTALEGAAPALKARYATAQSDSGHPNPAGDARWSIKDGKLDEVALRDFAYGAVHEMTVAGKKVVARYYGRPQSVAIFQGCSTGGRMALMEAQRFPDDYDGITAGASAYSWRAQSEQMWRDVIFARPGAALSADNLKLLHQAVLDACDGLDGLKDGVVTDPTRCRFDPATLRCKAGAAANCLTDAQVQAVLTAYRDVRTGGRAVAYGLTYGGEASWSMYANTTADPKRASPYYGMRWAMFGDPDFRFDTYDPARDLPRAEAEPYAKTYEARDPDLSRFVGHGGKLLIWHGINDGGPSYRGSIDYYEAVQRTTGPKVGAKKLDGSVRLFLLPGVYHCGGGPGADRFDALAAIDAWIQSGRPPERLVAAKKDGSMQRPLCPYPALPYYDGKGDAKDEKSFACRKS